MRRLLALAGLSDQTYKCGCDHSGTRARVNLLVCVTGNRILKFVRESKLSELQPTSLSVAANGQPTASQLQLGPYIVITRRITNGIDSSHLVVSPAAACATG